MKPTRSAGSKFAITLGTRRPEPGFPIYPGYVLDIGSCLNVELERENSDWNPD